MMRKLTEIPTKGRNRFVIYKNTEASINPYYLKSEWYDGCKHRTKLIRRYADYASCLYHILQANENAQHIILPD